MRAPGTFVCLTNIPTPYRLFQFGLMHKELRSRDWNFEVWFMSRSEPGRDWQIRNWELPFPHRFLSGIQFAIGRARLHLNPEILRALHSTRPDVLLIAGGWANPTVWLALANLHASRRIFWSESHLGSIRDQRWFVNRLRRAILSKFDEFAVPGRLARQYVEHYARPKHVYDLPNLVHPLLYEAEVRRLRESRFAGIPGTPDARHTSNGHGRDRRRVLLIAARLEREKGLLPFLEAACGLGSEQRLKVEIVIAGSGSLAPRLERWRASHDLRVRLLGPQSQEEMLTLYAQADGFCLPSLSDPNPLSVIEALWAGLPLLLSTKVGNHPECLEQGKNGFAFDPLKASSVQRAISNWLALSPDELADFGKRSKLTAYANFWPYTVIPSFIEQILPEPWRTLVMAAADASR